MVGSWKSRYNAPSVTCNKHLSTSIKETLSRWDKHARISAHLRQGILTFGQQERDLKRVYQTQQLLYWGTRRFPFMRPYASCSSSTYRKRIVSQVKERTRHQTGSKGQTSRNLDIRDWRCLCRFLKSCNFKKLFAFFANAHVSTSAQSHVDVVLTVIHHPFRLFKRWGLVTSRRAVRRHVSKISQLEIISK